MPNAGKKDKDAHDQVLDGVIKSASKLRLAFTTASSQATNLLQSIDQDPRWVWAKNDQNHGELTRLYEVLKMEIGHDLMSVLLTEPKRWKSEFGRSFLQTQLERLVNSVSAHIDRLHSKCKSLVAMHKVAIVK